MSIEQLFEEFNAWLAERSIEGVEINENLGAAEDITAITFPIPEDDGYISYDIIATVEEEAPFYFYIDYCDIPDVDELELLGFINRLNSESMLSVTAEDGHLCFSYTLPSRFITSGEDLALTFFDVWDAVDEMREAVRDAFGMSEEESSAAE